MTGRGRKVTGGPEKTRCRCSSRVCNPDVPACMHAPLLANTFPLLGMLPFSAVDQESATGSKRLNARCSDAVCWQEPQLRKSLPRAHSFPRPPRRSRTLTTSVEARPPVRMPVSVVCTLVCVWYVCLYVRLKRSFCVYEHSRYVNLLYIYVRAYVCICVAVLFRTWMYVHMVVPVYVSVCAYRMHGEVRTHLCTYMCPYTHYASAGMNVHVHVKTSVLKFGMCVCNDLSLYSTSVQMLLPAPVYMRVHSYSIWCLRACAYV